MFRGEPWFAWFPVVANRGGHLSLAWLETVWRDRTYDKSGAVTSTRYYTR
jgi:hypothetical protein